MSNAGDVQASDPAPPLEALPGPRTLLKLALEDEEAARRLSPALSHHLVLDNPYDRAVARKIKEHVREYGTPPERNDLRSWIRTLPERRRRTTAKTLSRIQNESLEGYTPEAILDTAEAALKAEAARNAISRAAGAPDEDRTPEMLRELFDSVEDLEPIGPEDDRPAEVTYAELVEEVDEDEGVPTVVPRFCWRGWTTLLAGRKGTGKSTLATAAAAAASKGRDFLGQEVEEGEVLYVSLEEGRRQMAERLRHYGPHPERLHVRFRLEANPLSELEDRVREIRPDLLVVDHLMALATDLNPDLDPGNSADWYPILRPLRELGVRYDMAELLLHHGRKSDGTSRDSSAIQDIPDVEFHIERGEEHSVRRLNVLKQRHVVDQVPDFAVRRAGTAGAPRFELLTGSLPARQQILSYVGQHPGASKRAIRDAVSGRAERVDSTLGQLTSEGEVEHRGQGNDSGYYPPS